MSFAAINCSFPRHSPRCAQLMQAFCGKRIPLCESKCAASIWFVTGNKDIELHAGDLTIGVGDPTDYAHVQASVTTGDIDAKAFGESHGGLFRRSRSPTNGVTVQSTRRNPIGTPSSSYQERPIRRFPRHRLPKNKIPRVRPDGCCRMADRSLIENPSSFCFLAQDPAWSQTVIVLCLDQKDRCFGEIHCTD